MWPARRRNQNRRNTAGSGWRQEWNISGGHGGHKSSSDRRQLFGEELL